MMILNICLSMLFCLIFVGCSLQNSDKQTDSQGYLNQSTSYAHEDVRDDLLKMYDKMINERLEKMDKISEQIKKNSNSAELFYKRALLGIEMREMENVLLHECMAYKESGQAYEESAVGITDVVKNRLAKDLNKEMFQILSNHPDCHKSGDSQALLMEYNKRTITGSNIEKYNFISDLSRAIELNSHFTEAYILRADYSKDQDRDRLSDYSKALENEKDANTYLKRAIVYIDRLGYFDTSRKAFDDCSLAIRLNPKLADAYVCRAIFLDVEVCDGVLNKSGNEQYDVCLKNEAVKNLRDFKRALVIEPNFPLLTEYINRLEKEIEDGNVHRWAMSRE